MWEEPKFPAAEGVRHVRYPASQAAGQKDTEYHTEGDAGWQGDSWNPNFPSLILQVDLEGEGRLDPARQGPKTKGQWCAHIVDLLIIGKLGTNKMVIV